MERFGIKRVAGPCPPPPPDDGATLAGIHREERHNLAAAIGLPTPRLPTPKRDPRRPRFQQCWEDALWEWVEAVPMEAETFLRPPEGSCGLPEASGGLLRLSEASCGFLRLPEASCGLLRPPEASLRPRSLLRLPQSS